MTNKKKREDSETKTEIQYQPQNAGENTLTPELVDRVNDNSAQENIKKKKKKVKAEQEHRTNSEQYDPSTVSIAIPGSIINNTQSFELATRLAGQIARAATIFRIDEVVIFDSVSTSPEEPSTPMTDNCDENESGAAFFIRILTYLETPQYLRRALFPRHNNLRFVGLLPPLDAPHHPRKHEWRIYREGVTLQEKAPNSVGTLVDVGLSKRIVIDQKLEPGKRVTVAMGSDRKLYADLQHEVVSCSKPREDGIYWGYKVRYASSISSVLNNCPFKGGYDYLIGTSEHGTNVRSSELSLPSFRHLLIAFGGLAGLEECVEEDNKLKGKNVQDLFNLYLNTCPYQGSRTIRTEEAVLISLQYFQEPISRAVGKRMRVKSSWKAND